jgi:hypothetical protein
MFHNSTPIYGIMMCMKSHMRSIIAYRITTERYLLAAG